jgi:hypothetical protein
MSEHYDVAVNFRENRTVDEIKQELTFLFLNNIKILTL